MITTAIIGGMLAVALIEGALILALWCDNRELKTENNAYRRKLKSKGINDDIKGLSYKGNRL